MLRGVSYKATTAKPFKMDDPNCPYCHGDIGYGVHALLQCQVAHAKWAMVDTNVLEKLLIFGNWFDMLQFFVNH